MVVGESDTGEKDLASCPIGAWRTSTEVKNDTSTAYVAFWGPQ